MKMMTHQCYGLALFLDAAPDHQLSQCLACAGHAMQSYFFLAASLLPHRSLCLTAVFADRSFCWAAMAYLFYSAGWQVMLNLAEMGVR